VCERSDAGGARHGGRFRHHWCVLPGASVLPDRALCLHWRFHGDYAGRAAVFESSDRAANEEFWHQYHWPGAKRLFAGTFTGAEARLPAAVALEVEYVAGAGRDEKDTE